jgi:hypothetical protein
MAREVGADVTCLDPLPRDYCEGMLAMARAVAAAFEAAEETK